MEYPVIRKKTDQNKINGDAKKSSYILSNKLAPRLVNFYNIPFLVEINTIEYEYTVLFNL